MTALQLVDAFVAERTFLSDRVGLLEGARGDASGLVSSDLQIMNHDTKPSPAKVA